MLKRKKLLAALLAGTMMLSLVGCGKKADTSGDTTDTTEPTFNVISTLCHLNRIEINILHLFIIFQFSSSSR